MVVKQKKKTKISAAFVVCFFAYAGLLVIIVIIFICIIPNAHGDMGKQITRKRNEWICMKRKIHLKNVQYAQHIMVMQCACCFFTIRHKEILDFFFHFCNRKSRRICSASEWCFGWSQTMEMLLCTPISMNISRTYGTSPENNFNLNNRIGIWHNTTKDKLEMRNANIFRAHICICNSLLWPPHFSNSVALNGCARTFTFCE